MKRDGILWFLRPTLLAVACFGIAMLLTTFLSDRDYSMAGHAGVANVEAARHALAARQGEVIRQGEESIVRMSLAMNSIRTPEPSIAPEAVVRIQMDALASAEQADGVLQCFTFASPGNRIATGPIERFGQMIRAKPYNVLIDRDAAVIGAPHFVDGVARILVTVVGKRKPTSFVWVLSRQTTTPFADCWMTDGVFLLTSRQQSQTTPDSSAIPLDEI